MSQSSIVDLSKRPVSADVPAIHEAMAAVQRDVGAVAKTRKKDAGVKFAFRGVDEVVNAVAPALIANHVTVHPADVAIVDRKQLPAASGKSVWSVVLRVEWLFTGPAGDTVSVVSLGESQDWSDKGIAQAFSVAQREMLVKTFSIPTEAAFESAEREEIAAPFAMRGAATPAKPVRTVAQLQKAIRECASEMELTALGQEIAENPRIKKGSDEHRELGNEWKEMQIFLRDAPPPTNPEDEADWMKGKDQ